jgi:hypothetical protein
VLSLDNNVSGEFVGLGLKKKSAEKKTKRGSPAKCTSKRKAAN